MIDGKLQYKIGNKVYCRKCYFAKEGGQDFGSPKSGHRRPDDPMIKR